MVSLLLFIILLPFLWSLYLAVMYLDTVKRQGRLTPAAKVIAMPLLWVGLGVDVSFNLVWGTMIFLDIPREWLFTSRISRLNDLSTWRGELARWVCRELLDPFDPEGEHCR